MYQININSNIHNNLNQYNFPLINPSTHPLIQPYTQHPSAIYISMSSKPPQAPVAQDQKLPKAGIPKDWTPPSLQISTDIKFIDMSMQMKQYTLQLTEYIYYQMVKGQIAYLKDAAESVKKGFEEQYGGSWHVVCGVNFGSYFGYEAKCCALVYRNHVGFLIWKFG